MRDDEELAFYRAVEDHFARLRGTAFLFTPKDFALLRQWWREGVPLAAVLTGIGEVMARRRERDGDPVSSLSYCRHAVTRHARRLASAGAGASAPAGSLDARAALVACAAAVRAAASSWQHVAAVASGLEDLARAVEGLPGGAEPAALAEALAGLERTSLEALAAVLPAELARRLEEGSEEGRAREGLAPEVRDRTRAAVRLKRLRELLQLPRLELVADAP